VIHWVIDVLEGTMVLEEAPGSIHRLSNRPLLFRILPNRFIPQDFVFRCKVVAGS